MEQSTSHNTTLPSPTTQPPATAPEPGPASALPAQEPASPAASASEPHGSHEEHQHQPVATSVASTQTTSFRKPVPLPSVPIIMPAPAHLSESPQQIPVVSPPQTPSILRMPSPNYAAIPGPDHQEQGTNAVAGPSSIAKQKQRASPQHSSEEDNVQTAGSEHSAGRHARASTLGFSDGYGHGDGNGGGYGNNGGQGGPSQVAGIRPPARVASTGRPAMQRQSRSVMLTEPPIIPVPAQNGLADLNPTALVSQPSVIDHVVPTVPVVSGAGTINGHARRQSMVTSQATLTMGKTVEERLQPTLDDAEAERDRAALKAKAHAWALNCAIGAQVILGALTTGVAAATTGRNTSIATSVLGGMSTLAASYLAKARGSGEPEVSMIRRRELESFIRDCKAFMLDKGYMVGSEYDARIERYRRRFEEIMGNGSGGVGDQVQAQTRTQAQAQAHTQREKTTLPV
ncbi:hypothetical protein BD414DRAFT_496409 [Trametes punicea]|nr:hypothetical protein BD414DRAFT_496409 [Trametes punicea]